MSDKCTCSQDGEAALRTYRRIWERLPEHLRHDMMASMKSWSPSDYEVMVAEEKRRAEKRGGCSRAAHGSAFRALCETHQGVNYKTAWGCPECVREMRELLKGALHALRSYQYGNTAPDLAESLANKIEQMVSPNTD